ncbi:MAG TPA: 30S ribosomal protein THX [bacterium]|nr:30S ribosomal protein THX [bacterium]HDP98971.1 30S ribosomal protein THX [bacterium]
MGKGDQRSRRGKIFRGTTGKSRPKKRNKKSSK